jgi:hypothetical protein
MQAPSGQVGPTVTGTSTGAIYVADAHGQILAHENDVGGLLGQGFVALTAPRGRTVTTNHTLGVADLNRKLAVNSAAGVTVTIPDNLLAIGVDADVVIQQIGAGIVTVSGTDVRNSQSHTGSSGQNAQIVLSTIPNVPNAWILAGDTA